MRRIMSMFHSALCSPQRSGKVIDLARERIDYAESGSGPTVVLVPGSCSTGAAWRPIMAAWEGRFRCVTTSLLGYGGTAERRTEATAAIEQEAEVVETVIRRAGGARTPVHVVGHSFGGLVAAVVAMRKRVPMASLTIVEAPAAEVLRSTDEVGHYQAFREMTDAYFAAWRDGEEDAIARMIDFYGGAGTFASWPERVRAYAVETTAANILDWKCAYDFPLSPVILAEITAPSLILTGTESHPAARRANELLGQHMPDAWVATLAGGSHFMIATHADEVAELIETHISWTEAQAA
jgi:pimeloyl-ACP methyl ester carboxylesterase